MKDFTEAVKELRIATGACAREIQELASHPDLGHSTPPKSETIDVSEVDANLILAYRHLEDARMRLGKAIQAYDGGTSVYDK